DRRVRVHHLLGGDDLELVGIRVEAVALRGGADLLVVLLDQLERPVARIGKRPLRARAGGQRLLRQRPLGTQPAARRRALRQAAWRVARGGRHAATPSALKRSRKTG